MAETIRLEPGSQWKNPWTGVISKVLSLDGESITVEQSDGETRTYPSARSFLDCHVAV